VWQGEPLFLEDLVFKPSHSLVEQSILSREAKMDTNADGFGLGWYAHRPEPCVYRDILPAWSDENLKNIAAHVRSSCFFAHVRASTGMATARANCHPFSEGKWLFMHNGQIGDYCDIRRAMEREIPDQYYDQRLGNTDSETMFAMALGLGLAKDPVAALKKMLTKVQALLTERGSTDAVRFTVALTDGETLYAIRFSTDHLPPSLYYRSSDKGLAVVSEPLDEEADGWQEVPGNHMVIARGGKVVATEAFDLTARLAA
jgi:glutamine amidotransferase